ncbi:zinc finger protein 84-like [Rhopalosiphum maidis]|uniref:zinc finger protein 84-like n=1 Tax=Rhopalosiphum maidis TaxID=43146 RepID=UPI000EFF9789|nr:zinc finger protein 84-like [Rhopalosiphum maidis]
MSQMHLHSENFDLCRVCLLEPESDRSMRFVHIFTAVNGDFILKKQLEELLGIKVEANDVKPKMVCDNCFKSLFSWYEMKKKAAESEIVINYIALKKFGATNPGTSMELNSTQDLSVNKQTVIYKNLNDPCSSGSSSSFSKQDTSSCSMTTNNLKSEYDANESDDDSVQIINFNEIIDLAGDSEDNEDNKNNEDSEDSEDSEDTSEDSEDGDNNEYPEPEDMQDFLNELNANASDDDESVNNDVKNEFIYTSNNEESADNSFCSEARAVPSTSGYRSVCKNNENEKLYYCSICQKKNYLNHDCSQNNKNFFTCLVPNCHILSRSKEDFIPHYQLHIGMPSSAVMCNRCYQEIKSSDHVVNGYHRHCSTVNTFKCYSCNTVFSCMEEFAYHKLKKHNGLLMDSNNNYLCLYCEESSPELPDILEHIKQCLESQAQTGTTIRMKLKIPTKAKTELIPVARKTLNKKKVQRKKKNKTNNKRTSGMTLFSCLKPSCDFVFQTFTIFKHHYREHFGLGNKLICWQCCNAFNDFNGLRAHQVRDVCCKSGMFECPKCPEKFDDIQSLSIHKYICHDCTLIAAKKSNKTISCEYCKLEMHIFNFKSHMTACKEKNNIKNTDPLKKHKGCYQCKFCVKVFHSRVSVSNHMRSHKSSLNKTT